MARDLAKKQESMAKHCTRVFSPIPGEHKLICSHITALQLIGVELPRLEEGELVLNADTVHICSGKKAARPRLDGVKSHYWYPTTTSVTALKDFCCVSPIVAWEQMAAWVSLVELVVLGDSMMRRAWNLKKATFSQFNEALSRDRNFRGRRKCLRALPLMRENTDSSQETRLRLRMEAIGFSGAVVNMKMADSLVGKTYYFDIAYPQLRIVLEYNGQQHGKRAQWKVDIDKRRFLHLVGWELFEVFAEDLMDDTRWNILIASIVAVAGTQEVFALGE